MSKNQHKEKLLLLLHIFQRESDENHPLSVPKLLDKLQANGIMAERKSVYGDVETLRNRAMTLSSSVGEGITWVNETSSWRNSNCWWTRCSPADLSR